MSLSCVLVLNVEGAEPENREYGRSELKAAYTEPPPEM
jgi:hypothetical protein